MAKNKIAKTDDEMSDDEMRDMELFFLQSSLDGVDERNIKFQKETVRILEMLFKYIEQGKSHTTCGEVYEIRCAISNLKNKIK